MKTMLRKEEKTFLEEKGKRSFPNFGSYFHRKLGFYGGGHATGNQDIFRSCPVSFDEHYGSRTG